MNYRQSNPPDSEYALICAFKNQQGSELLLMLVLKTSLALVTKAVWCQKEEFVSFHGVIAQHCSNT